MDRRSGNREHVPMLERTHSDLARSLYAALAAGDRDRLDALLHPDFVGEIAEGMPFGIGGRHEGASAMRRNGWGAIARHFTARAEPERFLEVGEGRLLVTGRYRGEGKQGGSPLDAAFAGGFSPTIVDSTGRRSCVPILVAGGNECCRRNTRTYCTCPCEPPSLKTRSGGPFKSTGAGLCAA